MKGDLEMNSSLTSANCSVVGCEFCFILIKYIFPKPLENEFLVWSHYIHLLALKKERINGGEKSVSQLETFCSYSLCLKTRKRIHSPSYAWFLWPVS